MSNENRVVEAPFHNCEAPVMREVEGQESGEHEISGLEKSNVPCRIPVGYTLAESQQDQGFWLNVVIHIALTQTLGGLIAFYALVIAGSGFSIGIAELTVELLLGTALIAVLCFMLSLIVSVLAAFAAHVVCGMLKIDSENMTVGVIVGGITGLVLTLLWGPWFDRLTFYSLLLMATATALGQYGGARGAMKWLAQQKLLRSTGRKIAKRPGRPFQFSIQQLLVVTTCCAVVLAAMKLVGMLTVNFLYYLGLWLAIQVAGLCIVAVINGDLQRRLSGTREQRE